MPNPTYSDYLNLSNNAYENTTSGQTVADAPPGFSASRAEVDTSTGFQATVYHSDTDPNVVVVAFAGTQLNPSIVIGDATADSNIANGVTPAAQAEANNLVAQEIANNPDTQIFVTGHSLGGTLAEGVKFALGDAVAGGATFGSPGVPNEPGDTGQNDPNWAPNHNCITFGIVW